MERQILNALLDQDGDDHSDLPEEIMAQLARFGLVHTVSTGSGRGHVVTNLGRHYAESFERGEELAGRLAEVEQLRTEFLSTVAHELRTPLTAIRTSVGLLMDPAIHADPDTHHLLLENISTSADRMQHLVSDLLDLARFRSGHLQLQIQRIDLRDVARAATDALKPQVYKKRQRVELTLPKRPVRVDGDRWRLEQAMVNLLSNACKFSGEGTTIKVVIETEGDAVVLRVSDDGPGISADDMERLFETFFTRRRDTLGPSEGTGLGLPIALAVAHAHGGTIVVDSELGRGSTFAIRIPRNRAEPSVA